MKILVVGGGGREHALAWKLSQSPAAEKISDLAGHLHVTAGRLRIARRDPAGKTPE